MIKNASAQTNFGKADSKLSYLASLISMINRDEHECYEDIRAFSGPSECYTLVSKQYHYARLEAFNQYGITEEQFDDAIKERTSEKWIHFHSTLI